MILTDKEIRRYSQREDGPLIAPFHEDQLQAASYDVQLSGRIATFKKTVQTVDLSDPDFDGTNLYEEVQFMDDDGYILNPHEYVLVELQEVLTIPDNCVAHIRPRTRHIRGGLLVVGQHCNPTYSGKLFIGICNMSPNAFRIKRGIRIAQVVFEELTGSPSYEKQYENKNNAAYMNETEFRGSVPSEIGWTEKLQQSYQELLRGLKEGL